MLYQIKGIKYFDFFNDKNEHVHGIKFFCTTDTEDEDVLGCTVDTFYVAAKSERFEQFKSYCTSNEKLLQIVDTYFDLEFNRKGKIVNLTWLGTAYQQVQDTSIKEKAKGLSSETPITKNV